MDKNITQLFTHSKKTITAEKSPSVQSAPSALSLQIISQFARSYHVADNLPIEEQAMVLN